MKPKTIERISIEDGSSWPNPANFGDLIWRAIHAYETLSKYDCKRLAGIAESYSMLIIHPAMTLKKTQKKISMIRKAKEDNET